MSMQQLTTRLSFIQVKLINESITLTALIDNGAQVSLILLKHVKNRTAIIPVDFNINSASGHSLNITGAIMLDVQIGGMNMSLPFAIVEDFTYDMVLSNQAFRKYAALINYSTNTCQFTDLETKQHSQEVNMFSLHLKQHEYAQFANVINVITGHCYNVHLPAVESNRLKCPEILLGYRQISDLILYYYVKMDTCVQPNEWIYMRIAQSLASIEWNLVVTTRRRRF
jgi:hypothetical protein